MRTHARSEQLLAAAIDFSLTPAEQTEVADHLATCPTCRALAAAYRTDASGLREIAFAEPPARVSSVVLRAATRPPARTIEPWKLLLAAALLLTSLLGAAAGIGAWWNSRPALVVVVPTASPSAEPGQSPAASSPTIVALDPVTAHWTKVGVVDASGPLVASGSGGYAMLAPGADGTVTTVMFSTDGQTWVAANLADLVTNCPGWGPPGNEQVNDAVAGAIATNGREFVVVGEEQPHDAASCANVAASVRPVAWYSSDGRTWRRSAPFEVGGDNSRATAVWATPTGWQAAGVNTLWESIDGLTWHQVSGPSAAFSGVVAAGTAADGTVVRLDTITSGLFATHDGQTWAPVNDAGGCDAAPGATQILGPTEPGLGAWVVLDDMRLCTSRDLVSWSGTTMTAAPAAVAQTRYGAIVVANACFGEGVTCASDPRGYLSADGITWSPLAVPPDNVGSVVMDGPAGVLMIGGSTVWRLDQPAGVTASPVEIPAALQVTCDGTRSEIPTLLVKTQPDGIHLDVANTSGQPLDFSIDDANGLAIQGDSVPGLSGSFIYPFGPGSYRLTCNTSTTAFTVVDPGGLYTSSDLQCGSTGGGAAVGTNDYAAGAQGPRGLLLDIARQELRGLQPGDIVERAGYPQTAGHELVRVVRSGQVVAVLGYADDGHGGWLLGGTQACSGSNLAAVPPKG